MNPFTLLDSWLLDKVQNIVNTLYKYFSVDKTILAKLSLVTGLIFCTLYLYFKHFMVAPFNIAVSIVVNMLIFFLLWKQISGVENEGSDNALSVGMLNLSFVRAIFLAVTLFALISSLPHVIWGVEDLENNVLKQQRHHLFHVSFVARWLLCTVSLYFASCKTPPKSKSWLEEKSEKLRELLRPAPPAPQLSIV